MRRFALSVAAVVGLALVAGCSGGTGLSTGTQSNPTSFTFTNGSAQTNDFFVSPSGGVVQIDAIVQKGNGIASTIVPDQPITWAARYATAADPASVNTYTVGPVPTSAKTCPFLASTAPTPAVPIYTQSSAGTLSPLGNGGLSQVVYVGAVATVPPPYCLVVQATDTNNGLIGHVTVVVSNSP